MNLNGSRHKAASGAFAIVFFLFTVGLPIIVASCPMTKVPGQAACCACPIPSAAGIPAIGTPTNSSCCKTVIASGRNLMEYLTVAGVASITLEQSEMPAQIMLPSLSVSRSGIPSVPMPRAPDDIPILNSSLLI